MSFFNNIFSEPNDNQKKKAAEIIATLESAIRALRIKLMKTENEIAQGEILDEIAIKTDLIEGLRKNNNLKSKS